MAWGGTSLGTAVETREAPCLTPGDPLCRGLPPPTDHGRLDGGEPGGWGVGAAKGSRLEKV